MSHLVRWPNRSSETLHGEANPEGRHSHLDAVGRAEALAFRGAPPTKRSCMTPVKRMVGRLPKRCMGPGFPILTSYFAGAK